MGLYSQIILANVNLFFLEPFYRSSASFLKNLFKFPFVQFRKHAVAYTTLQGECNSNPNLTYVPFILLRGTLAIINQTYWALQLKLPKIMCQVRNFRNFNFTFNFQLNEAEYLFVLLFVLCELFILWLVSHFVKYDHHHRKAHHSAKSQYKLFLSMAVHT